MQAISHHVVGLNRVCKGGVEVALGAGVQDLELQCKTARGGLRISHNQSAAASCTIVSKISQCATAPDTRQLATNRFMPRPL
jgi:hypothetical protein